MIVKDTYIHNSGTVVNETINYHRHSESTKFCHEGLTEFIYEQIVLEGMEDDSTGDSDFGYATLLGKRILWGHTSGMVTLSRFRSTAEARSAFEDFANEYNAFECDDDSDSDSTLDQALEM